MPPPTPQRRPTLVRARIPARRVPPATAQNAVHPAGGGGGTGNSTGFGADQLNARIAAGAPMISSQPTAAMATVPAHLLDNVDPHTPGAPAAGTLGGDDKTQKATGTDAANAGGRYDRRSGVDGRLYTSRRDLARFTVPFEHPQSNVRAAIPTATTITMRPPRTRQRRPMPPARMPPAHRHCRSRQRRRTPRLRSMPPCTPPHPMYRSANRSRSTSNRR